MTGAVGGDDDLIRIVLADANVLYSRVLRDYLLYAADQEIIAIAWSPAILAEVTEHLRRNVPGFDDAAQRLEHSMDLANHLWSQVTRPDNCLQYASMNLVTTLYIRDVSEVVAETLKERAAAAGMSLSAYVAGELAKIAARPTNAEIVARLRARDRSAGPSTTEIIEAVRENRR